MLPRFLLLLRIILIFQIIIVHNSDVLVTPRLTPEAREKIAAKLEQKSVKVEYGELLGYRWFTLERMPYFKTYHC